MVFPAGGFAPKIRKPGRARKRRRSPTLTDPGDDPRLGYYNTSDLNAGPGTRALYRRKPPTERKGMLWMLEGYVQNGAGLQPPPSPGGDGILRFLLSILPLIFFFVIAYVFLILPTQRQQKKHRQLLASLKAGDRVVTNSGIYGTIVKVGEKTFKLRIADKVVITVEKSAIAGLQPAESEAEV
jgi:preprotein translocase subunit YajC